MMTMPFTECNTNLTEFGKTINDASIKYGLRQGQYCIFHPKGCDACGGDSGGPVQYFNNSRFSTVVAVTSFGFGCGNRPSINTRVAYYLDWIESVVWPNGFRLN